MAAFLKNGKNLYSKAFGLSLGMVLCFASHASAIERYQSLSMSCGEIQNTIARQGAVIFRYPSTKVKGMVLYDRYVRNDWQCDRGYAAMKTTLPSRDSPACPVLNCQMVDDDDHRFPFFVR